MSLHDSFEPYYINMGRNGIDPVGCITDAECTRVCTAPTNKIADMIVAALNRDAGFNVEACAQEIAVRAEDAWFGQTEKAKRDIAEILFKHLRREFR